VLNEEKRNRLAEVIARRQESLDGAGGSTPIVPLAIVPLADVPLAAAQASPAPAHL